MVTLKVAAPTILYSCVASNVAQERRDPRVLFQKFLDLFNKQLIKPILKYTQVCVKGRVPLNNSAPVGVGGGFQTPPPSFLVSTVCLFSHTLQSNLLIPPPPPPK